MADNKVSNGNVESSVASELVPWYNGKCVLITGATGFIGKVLLEKILRCLSNCDTIYVLLRPKAGLTPQQRVDKMLNNEPFNSIPKTNFKKVVAVDGDISQERLGLSQSDHDIIIERVNVVFNVAASIRFDAPIKLNLRDNYTSLRGVMALCQSIKQIDCLVHVSTYFSNCHLPHIKEELLPMKHDPEKMAELINWLPDHVCDKIEPMILEDRPNTYIFTKAMGENYVAQYEGQFPIAVVRPSIVLPSLSEPVPGWVDNVNGPMGLASLGSLGLLRTIDWNYDGKVDFVPVDHTANCILAVAKRCKQQHPDKIVYYNATASNPVTWGKAFEKLRAESLKMPPLKMLRIPIAVPRHKRANKVSFTMTKIFSELLFAYIIDFILMLCGQKKILMKLTAKMHHAYDVLRAFTTNEWTNDTDNFDAAYKELNDTDKRLFNFNSTCDWGPALSVYCQAARRYILKEDPSTIGKAIIKMRIMYVVEFIIKIMFYASLAYVLSLAARSIGGKYFADLVHTVPLRLPVQSISV